MLTSRRKFLIGAVALMAAPSIVQTSSLMKLQGIPLASFRDYSWVGMVGNGEPLFTKMPLRTAQILSSGGWTAPGMYPLTESEMVRLDVLYPDLENGGGSVVPLANFNHSRYLEALAFQKRQQIHRTPTWGQYVERSDNSSSFDVLKRRVAAE